jgi:hypothetical protein
MQTTAQTTSAFNTTYYTTLSQNTTIFTNTNTTINTPTTTFSVSTTGPVYRLTNFFRPKEVSQTNLMLNLDARISAGNTTWRDQSGNSRNATVSGTVGASDRCVALYNFHSDATDLTGNHTGTENNITYGRGNFGQAAVFNGSSSQIATGLTLPADSSMSFSFWLKSASNSSGNNYFLSDFDSAGNNNSSRLSLAVSTNNGLRIWMSNGSSYWNSTDDIDLSSYINLWMNLVVVINGTDIKVYINGGTPTTLTSTVSFGTAGSRQQYIGGVGGNNGASYEGSIDQVRIFNKALSSAEVTQLYNENSSTFKKVDIFNDALIGHYDLDSTDNFYIPQFITDQNFTIGGWFYRDTATSTTLWSQGFAPSVRCQITGSSEISIYIHNGSSGASYNIGVNAPTGEWFHLMKTYDLSAGTVKVYLNSALKKTQTVMTGNIYSSGNSDAFFRISKNSSNNNGYLDGKISQVRVYDSVLTDTQIVDDYSTHDYLYI